MKLLVTGARGFVGRNLVSQLRNIAEVAAARAPALGRNTSECVRLYENWLAVLNEQPTDEAYLEEEISLSRNRIHKSVFLTLANPFLCQFSIQPLFMALTTYDESL